jgi:hypothetical protein
MPAGNPLRSSWVVKSQEVGSQRVHFAIKIIGCVMYIQTRLYIYTYVHKNICIYIYTYTHTHRIHIHIYIYMHIELHHLIHHQHIRAASECKPRHSSGGQVWSHKTFADTRYVDEAKGHPHWTILTSPWPSEISKFETQKWPIPMVIYPYLIVWWYTM